MDKPSWSVEWRPRVGTMDIHRQLLPPGCSPNMSSPNSGCGSRMHGISGGPRCTLQRTKDVSNEVRKLICYLHGKTI